MYKLFDVRDRVGKTGSCSRGRALLSKALIQLSADVWAPSLLVLWDKTTQSWGLRVCGMLNSDLQESLCHEGHFGIPELLLPVSPSLW